MQEFERVDERWTIRKLYLRGGVYYGHVRDSRTGRVHWHSTGETNKRRAAQAMRKFVEELKAREEKTVRDGIKLGPAMREWLELKTLRPSTRKTTDYDLSGTYLPSFGEDKIVNEIDYADIEKFLKALEKRGLSARTRKRHLAALRGFFRWCRRRRYIGEDPTEGLKVPRGEKRKGVALDYEQARKLLEAARTPAIREIKDRQNREWKQRTRLPPWLFTAVLVGFHTGLRRQNIMNLRWAQIDFSKNTIEIHGRELKTGIDLKIPAHPELMDHFRELLKGRSKVNPRERVLGEKLTGKTSALESAAARAEVPRVTWHDLRRSFGTWLDLRYPRGIVKGLLGHVPGNVTDLYSIPPLKELQQAVNDMPRLLAGAGKEAAAQI